MLNKAWCDTCGIELAGQPWPNRSCTISKESITHVYEQFQGKTKQVVSNKCLLCKYSSNSKFILWASWIGPKDTYGFSSNNSWWNAQSEPSGFSANRKDNTSSIFQMLQGFISAVCHPTVLIWPRVSWKMSGGRAKRHALNHKPQMSLATMSSALHTREKFQRASRECT